MSKYNKSKTNSQIQRKNQWLPVGKEKEGEARQGQRIKRYKLLCIKKKLAMRIFCIAQGIQPISYDQKCNIIFKTCELLCFTHETYIILYINYTSIKKKETQKFLLEKK